jgi:uncharacterized protein (DUF697 family)
MSEHSDKGPEYNITLGQRKEADQIIQRYAFMGTATGFIPVFGADVAANTAIQTKMIVDLAAIYDYDIDEQLLRTVITTGITSLGSRILTGIAAALAKSFPLFSTLATSVARAAVSGFITMELGKLYQSMMEEGRNPAEVDVLMIVGHLVEQVQAGKWDPTQIGNPANHINYLLRKY